MGEVCSRAADLLSPCSTERGDPSDSTTGAVMHLVWQCLGFVCLGVPALGEMGGHRRQGGETAEGGVSIEPSRVWLENTFFGRGVGT